ncbi:MAG: class II fructose-bisphosphate aldolase [Candidatus Woesebacteria bacterium]|jgi:hypothetical protein
MKKDKMDDLVQKAVFGSDEQKQAARYQIWQLSTENKIIPASIHDLYLARAKNKLAHDFTVPAFNIKGLTYDTARAAFQAAKQINVGAMIFELARSEITYTNQSPQEYVTVIAAAAFRENWSGPLFIQGDHFQAKVSNQAGQPKTGEIETIKKLIRQAIKAGFYNIDIDMSTLVDLSQDIETEQQVANIKYSLEMTKLIRSLEPKGITISIGGEIGHIGGKNSTIADFEAFMNGFKAGLPSKMAGLSKISVQTGSHHGGVVLTDGSLADIKIDFSILDKISKLGREKYQLGGTVQHGASTLDDKYFEQFPASEAIEVHLATGIQNLQMDHPAFPQDLLNKIYHWLDTEQINEKKADQSTAQFHYKMRKKGWGQFKQEIWNIPEENKAKIRDSLAQRFSFFFKALNVVDSKKMVTDYVKPVIVEKTKADFLIQEKKQEDVSGLAD